jgi:hypothetical protein
MPWPKVFGTSRLRLELETRSRSGKTSISALGAKYSILPLSAGMTLLDSTLVKTKFLRENHLIKREGFYQVIKTKVTSICIEIKIIRFVLLKVFPFK